MANPPVLTSYCNKPSHYARRNYRETVPLTDFLVEFLFIKNGFHSLLKPLLHFQILLELDELCKAHMIEHLANLLGTIHNDEFFLTAKSMIGIDDCQEATT